MKIHSGFAFFLAAVAFAIGLIVGQTKPESALQLDAAHEIEVRPSDSATSTGTYQDIVDLGTSKLVRRLRANPSDPLEAKLLLLQLAKLDLKEAYQFPDLWTDELVARALGDVAQRSPFTALQQALQAPTKSLRDSGIGAIVRVSLEQDPDSALAILDKLPDPNVAQSALNQWARAFPDRAGLFWRKLPRDSSLFVSFITEVAAAKGKQDRGSAIKWYESHPELRRALGGLTQAFQEAEEFQEGADWLLTLPASSDRGDLLRKMTRQWADRDPSALLAWAATAPSGFVQEHAISAALGSISSTDPEAALEAFGELPDGSVRKATANTLGYRLGMSAPAVTIDWVVNLEPNLRIGILRDAFRTWSHQDLPKAATRYAELLDQVPENEAIRIVPFLADAHGRSLNGEPWLESLPVGPIKDAAIQGYTNQSIHNSGPELALAWTQEIGDEKVRTDTTNGLVEIWREIDPEGAEEAMGSP